MEIPTSVNERLANAGQSHLLSFWSGLNDQQRQMLLHDIDEIDFNRVRKAFEAVKQELSTDPGVHQNGTDNKQTENIDDIMEPIPDEILGSVDGTSEDDLERFLLRGSTIFQ